MIKRYHSSLNCSPTEGRLAVSSVRYYDKASKHSGTCFYVNVSLRFSGTTNQEQLLCGMVAWRFWQKYCWVGRCPPSPYKKRKNVRSSLESFVWMPRGTGRVRGYGKVRKPKHVQGLRQMPWCSLKGVSSKNHATRRVRGTNVWVWTGNSYLSRFTEGSLPPGEWCVSHTEWRLLSEVGSAGRRDVVRSDSPEKATSRSVQHAPEAVVLWPEAVKRVATPSRTIWSWRAWVWNPRELLTNCTT